MEKNGQSLMFNNISIKKCCPEFPDLKCMCRVKPDTSRHFNFTKKIALIVSDKYLI